MYVDAHQKHILVLSITRYTFVKLTHDKTDLVGQLQLGEGRDKLRAVGVHRQRLEAGGLAYTVVAQVERPAQRALLFGTSACMRDIRAVP